MSWFRVGDTAATDPRILALNDPRNPLLGPACFGFLVKLGTQSANHFTDYVIHPGFLDLAGGAAAPALLKRCIQVGLITFEGGRGAERRWKLIDTAPELFHIRLKDEVAWEKQQKSDTRNDRYRIAVLLRDGDACRYCGVVVQPNDNMSGRGRSLDHVRPGQHAARSADDLVVCCRSCNGARGKDWQDEDERDGFADRWPLLPPPAPLIFIRSTVVELEGKGHAVPAGSVIADKARDVALPTTKTSGPEARHPATQAGVAAPDRSTTAADDQHSTIQVDVATPDAGTAGATRPATQVGAAAPPSPAGQHHTNQVRVAATRGSTTAPECQHPAPAGVAAPESRTDRSLTDRSGTAGPGRVGSGSGRVGSPPTDPLPARPPGPPPSSSTTEPRRTRRGRRRPRSGGPA